MLFYCKFGECNTFSVIAPLSVKTVRQVSPKWPVEWTLRSFNVYWWVADAYRTLELLNFVRLVKREHVTAMERLLYFNWNVIYCAKWSHLWNVLRFCIFHKYFSEFLKIVLNHLVVQSSTLAVFWLLFKQTVLRLLVFLALNSKKKQLQWSDITRLKLFLQLVGPIVGKNWSKPKWWNVNA